MIASYAAQHIGDSLWYNSQLSNIAPQALASHLDIMEDRHLRILLRHGLTPLMVHCPVQARSTWLLPVLSVLVPLMHGRLSSRWGQIMQGSSSSSGAAQQQQQQLSEEVVGETLLREVTREYMIMLAKATERSGPAAATAGSGAAGNGNGNGAAAAAASAALAGPPPAAAAAVVPAECESVIETLWRYDGKAMQALMATAVAGMCWPDAQAAGKCTVICRYASGLSPVDS